MRNDYIKGFQDGRKYERIKARKVLGVDYLMWHDEVDHINNSNIILVDEFGIPLNPKQRVALICDDYVENHSAYPTKKAYYKRASEKFRTTPETIKSIIYKHNHYEN